MATFLVVISIVTMGWANAKGWYEDYAGFEKALAEQKETGNPVFVYFHNPYCKYCVQYETKVLNQKQVQTYLDRFIKVKVLWDQRGTPEDTLAKSLGAPGTPAVYVKYPEADSFTKVSYSYRKKGKLIVKTPQEYIHSLEQAKP